jgi:Phage tail tube protein
MTATYPGSGLLTQFYGPVAEGTYGVAPTLTGSYFYAIKGGETLASKKETVQGEGLFYGALHPQASRRVVTGWDADGIGFTLEAPTRHFQQWLYPMFGSYGQTAAALTEDSSTGAYKAIHAPGPLQGNSFAVQKGVTTVDGTTEPFTYVGCKIKEWELTISPKGIAQVAYQLIARNELAGNLNSDPLNVSLPALVSYSKPVGSVFHWAQMSLYTGGTASTTSGVTSVSGASLAGNIKQASIKYTTPLDNERYFANQAGFRSEPVDNGLRTITISYEVEWLAAAISGSLNSYYNDLPFALSLSFVGPTIGTGSDKSTLSFLVPETFIEGDPPKVGGTQVVTQTLNMAGLDDGTNNPIQATYWTTDST